MQKIAKFVNAKEIKQLFAASGTIVGYEKCIQIRKELRKAHPNVVMPNKRVIPISWIYEVYGIESYK